MRGKTFVEKGAKLTDMIPKDNSKDMSVLDVKKRRMTVIRPQNNSGRNSLGFALPESSRPFTPSGYGKQKTTKRTSKVDD